MTIQTISSNNTFTNQYFNANKVAQIQPSAPMNTLPKNELLTPEQQNNLQDTVNDKVIAQAEEIKANFQTAKDIDLTRAYYEQQQKLIDIYTQTGNESTSNSDPISVTKSLAETYNSLYQLHQSIKEGAQQLPNRDEPTQLPASEIPSVMNKETEAYINLAMPLTNSYMQMQA